MSVAMAQLTCNIAGGYQGFDRDLRERMVFVNTETKWVSRQFARERLDESQSDWTLVWPTTLADANDVNELKDLLASETDGASGADSVAITPITNLGAADTVQEALEAFDAKLTAETDSSSGADYVAITPITALGAADTVQEALEAFDAKLASETDSSSGADYVAITPIAALGAADTVQEALEAIVALLGDLSSLETTEKGSLVGAINEIHT